MQKKIFLTEILLFATKPRGNKLRGQSGEGTNAEFNLVRYSSIGGPGLA